MFPSAGSSQLAQYVNPGVAVVHARSGYLALTLEPDQLEGYLGDTEMHRMMGHLLVYVVDDAQKEPRLVASIHNGEVKRPEAMAA